MKQISWLSICFIIIYSLPGCVPGIMRTESSEGSIPNTRTIESSISTKTAALLLTHDPTATATPTIGKHPKTPTISNTPRPIIPMKPQAAATIEYIMKDPMKCPTFCFWGIEPGKTYLQDVRPVFSRLGFLPFESLDLKSGRGFYTIRYESEKEKDFSFTLFTYNDLIENIEITPHIQKLPEANSAREWTAYSPETLIKRYGKPRRVTLFVDWGPNFVMGMDMHFRNPDLIVRYSGYNMIPDRPRSPRLCPLTASFDYVRLWMGPNPMNPPVSGIELEKATNLSIDQFVELMMGDPQKACFIINGDEFQ